MEGLAYRIAYRTRSAHVGCWTLPRHTGLRGPLLQRFQAFNRQRSSCVRAPSAENTSAQPPPILKYRTLATASSTLAVLLVVVSALGGVTFIAHAEAPAETDAAVEPRKIRLAEVHKHSRDAKKLWVIRGDRVYDITEWIPNHPGGDVILRAAGGVIDNYWKIFSIHEKQEVYDILEQYFIGVVDPRDLVDGKVPPEEVDDPFLSDPNRDERLRVLSERPCNAETPISDLGEFITPNDVFYVRNHLWVPQTKDPNAHRLTIELFDGTEVEYTLKDLRDKFESHDVTATLQCSGNRRSHMTAGSRATNGLQWGVGAIGTAVWTGIKLRDVLKDAGMDVDDLADEIKHAQFSGLEAYGASIPIEKAVDKRGDVLLAYGMNGEPLPLDHGYPLRVVVPGHVAARSVKWINKISISDEESHSQWQRRDYKCFGPNEGTKPDWDAAASIQETPVQSAVTSLKDVTSGDRKMLEVYGLEEDSVALEGYAFAGGGRRIVRVDVSADNGHTWNQAELLVSDSKGVKAWAWQRWRFAIPKRQVGRWFLVKAIDEAYNSQPDSFEPQYNFRGNLTCAWQRVPYHSPQ